MQYPWEKKLKKRAIKNEVACLNEVMPKNVVVVGLILANVEDGEGCYHHIGTGSDFMDADVLDEASGDIGNAAYGSLHKFVNGVRKDNGMPPLPLETDEATPQ